MAGFGLSPAQRIAYTVQRPGQSGNCCSSMLGGPALLTCLMFSCAFMVSCLFLSDVRRTNTGLIHRQPLFSEQRHIAGNLSAATPQE